MADDESDDNSEEWGTEELQIPSKPSISTVPLQSHRATANDNDDEWLH